MKQDFDGEREEELKYYQDRWFCMVDQVSDHKYLSSLWKGIATGSLIMNVVFIILIGIMI